MTWKNIFLLTGGFFFAGFAFMVNPLIGIAGVAMFGTMFLFDFFGQKAQNIVIQRSKVLPHSLVELIQNQQNTYQNVFVKHPSDFHQPSYHYDWWMFPLEAPKHVSETSKKFSVNDKEVNLLLHHDQFMTTYIKSIDAYLNNVKQHGWNNYDIRYAKMVNSLNKFINVSSRYANQKNLVVMNKKLQALGSKVFNFAQRYIQSPSAFLKKGLSELSKSQPQKPTFSAIVQFSPKDKKKIAQIEPAAADPHAHHQKKKFK